MSTISLDEVNSQLSRTDLTDDFKLEFQTMLLVHYTYIDEDKVYVEHQDGFTLEELEDVFDYG